MQNFLKSQTFTSALAAIGVSLHVASCVTPQKSPSKATKASTAKNAQKDAKSEPKKAVAAAKPLPKTDGGECADWYVSLLKPDYTYTVKDRQYLSQLTSVPKPGSLAEACLVVGILRDVTTPPGSGPQNFATPDQMAKAQAEAKTSVIATEPQSTQQPLENRVRERGVDIASALSVNSYLKNSAVFTMAWNAAILDGNSEPFKQNVQTVIKAEAIIWQDIGRKVGVETATTQAAGQSPDQSNVPANGSTQSSIANVESNNPSAATTTHAGSTTGAAAAVPTPNTDAASTNADQRPPLSDQDSAKALAAAQEAASQENFEKAVSEAGKLSPGSQHYDVAQENLRQWSNKAVTELRKKAAFEYRTASSSTEPTAKKNSLSKAQSYLSEALKKFPNASNLDTVRDNLKMIESEMNH